jgi:mannose-6-phosphate isomerase-like protein (cupin superfamily)
MSRPIGEKLAAHHERRPAMGPVVHTRGELCGDPRSYAVVPPDPRGWTSVAIMEWELSGQEWVDQHPHAEFNYVLEGTLFVEAGGETVEVPAGSVVEVRGGVRGRYWAPVHARMLAIYGPNPDGAPSIVIGLRSSEVGYVGPLVRGSSRRPSDDST